MTDPGGTGFPFGMDPEAFRDAPLFRELQRVMASSSGPINWELARQVGIATALESGTDAEPTGEDRRILGEAVRVAELQVTSFTGIEPPAEVTSLRAIRRAEWVTANTEGLRGLLEPAATRMGDALDRAMREQLPEDAGPMAGLLTQLGPLLQGTQVGQVLGFLATRVLGQYDLAVPREGGTGSLLFVVPNLAAFEHDWSLDPVEFRTAVALHEVTHRIEFARPWMPARFRDLVDDFLSTLTIDIGAIQERFASLDPADPEAMQRAFGVEGDAVFGAILDAEQRIKLGRIQAFMAAAEGYADHVMHELGAQLLSSHAMIQEAMRRHREDEATDPVFERLLGVDMKREQYAAGRRFCDLVVEQTNEATLARMWDSADAMPSLPEIDEPRLWLARTV
jgi:putative hydrolase